MSFFGWEPEIPNPFEASGYRDIDGRWDLTKDLPDHIVAKLTPEEVQEYLAYRKKALAKKEANPKAAVQVNRQQEDIMAAQYAELIKAAANDPDIFKALNLQAVAEGIGGLGLTDADLKKDLDEWHWKQMKKNSALNQLYKQPIGAAFNPFKQPVPQKPPTAKAFDPLGPQYHQQAKKQAPPEQSQQDAIKKMIEMANALNLPFNPPQTLDPEPEPTKETPAPPAASFDPFDREFS